MRSAFVPFGLAAGLYLLLTIALTWPLILQPGSAVPNDLGDSLLNTFLLDWNTRAVPFTDEWWNLPQFYPVPGATAFSEHLLGLSVLTAPVILASGNALLGYNTAFLLSFPLCAFAAHLLCHAITRRHDASVLAGLGYGFSAYRMSQFSHVQVLSAYWIPAALLALHLFLGRPQWRWALLFAACWWLQALANGYYLFYFSVLVGLWLLWFMAGRSRWIDLAKILAAWGLGALAIVPVALGYWRWQHAYGFRRWPDEIQAFSADVASLLTAPENVRLWGWLKVVERPESQFFPGATILVVTAAGLGLAWVAAARSGRKQLRWSRILLALAAVFALAAATPRWFGPWKVEIFGLRLLSVGTPQKPFSIALLLAAFALAMHPSIRAAWRRRSPLAFYATAAVVMWLFSLGPAPTLMNEPLLYKAPYSWLMLLPGVDGIRVPARFWILATMCLAMAAALAYLQVVTRWSARLPAAPAIIGALLLIEAWPEPLRVIPAPAWRPSHTRAVARLELPLTSGHDLVTLYRAVEHRRPLVNGYSGYFAPHYLAMQHLLQNRDPMVLAHLRSLGAIEAVVDHDEGRARDWLAFIAAQPGAELVHTNESYTAYRLPRVAPEYSLPELQGRQLEISGIRASLYQDDVGRMIDGDRITRWHTGGPQDPENEVVVDLGSARTVRGVEMQIAGYIADFPRELTVELSQDGRDWRAVWSGKGGRLAFVAALKEPLTVPLRIPLDGSTARFVRMRQTASERIYYWSIAELRVFGS
jgi:hypothetical protein